MEDSIELTKIIPEKAKGMRYKNLFFKILLTLKLNYYLQNSKR
tara:strand:+ start:90 stop:218 length:129 start_codon:yes stop_codon:yes gene_type:complete